MSPSPQHRPRPWPQVEAVDPRPRRRTGRGLSQGRMLIVIADGLTLDGLARYLRSVPESRALGPLMRQGGRMDLLSQVPGDEYCSLVTTFTGRHPARHLRFQPDPLRHPHRGKEPVHLPRWKQDLFSLLADRGWSVGTADLPWLPHWPKAGSFSLPGLPLPPADHPGLTPALDEHLFQWGGGSPDGKESTRMLPLHGDDVAWRVPRVVPPEERRGSRSDLWSQEYEDSLDRVVRMSRWIMNRRPEVFACRLQVLSHAAGFLPDAWSDEAETTPGFQGIESAYSQLDSFVRILKGAMELSGGPFGLVLLSTHGHRPIHRVFRINRWLERHGFLKLEPGLGYSLPRAHVDQPWWGGGERRRVVWARTTAFAVLGGIRPWPPSRSSDDESSDDARRTEDRIMRRLSSRMLARIERRPPMDPQRLPMVRTSRGPSLVLPPEVDGYAIDLDPHPRGMVGRPRGIACAAAHRRGQLLFQAPDQVGPGRLPARPLQDVMPMILRLLDEEPPPGIDGRAPQDFLGWLRDAEDS